jgi:hypothetical protein
MSKNNYPFKNKNRGNYSKRNTGSYAARNAGNSNPRYAQTDGDDDGLYTTHLYFPQVSYSCGLRITENAGLPTLEAYKKRIPSHISDMDSIDKDFWRWAGSVHLPTIRCSDSERAIQLLNNGQAAAVFTQTRII